MNWLDFFNDDKNLVIIAVFLLGLGAMMFTFSAENAGLIHDIIIGLFGIAVGKAMK